MFERIIGFAIAIVLVFTLLKIVEMRYFGGMTAQEIADVMEISLATIGREKNRANAATGAGRSIARHSHGGTATTSSGAQRSCRIMCCSMCAENSKSSARWCSGPSSVKYMSVVVPRNSPRCRGVAGTSLQPYLRRPGPIAHANSTSRVNEPMTRLSCTSQIIQVCALSSTKSARSLSWGIPDGCAHTVCGSRTSNRSTSRRCMVSWHVPRGSCGGCTEIRR